MEAEMKASGPAAVALNSTDDYTEFCWHCLTVRFYIACPMLKAPKASATRPGR
jgi:aminobenzoyl-glutamate utilization protein B